jgi:hypothetical protein
VLSKRLLHTAVGFFVGGVALGIYMGAAHDFRLTHVHVHLNLLGWVALAMAGLLYAAYPELQRHWTAHAHYWLHTLGLLLFMGGFAWGALDGNFKLPPVAAGASMIGVGVLLFAWRVWTALNRAEAAMALHAGTTVQP